MGAAKKRFQKNTHAKLGMGFAIYKGEREQHSFKKGRLLCLSLKPFIVRNAMPRF